MKIFENKKLFKKIIMVLIAIIIIGFCIPQGVQAKGDDVGGKLLSPIMDFVVFLGDGLMNVVHTVIYHQNDTTITVDLMSNFWQKVLTVAVGVLAAVVVAAAIVFTAGAVVAAAAAIGVTLSTIGVGTVLLISVGAGVAGAVVFNSNVLPDDINLPVYQISPEQIFSNKVLLFDVDFFNPKEDQVAKDEEGNELKDENGNSFILESTAKTLRNIISNWYVVLRDISLVALLSILVYIGIRIIISSTSNDKAKYKQMLVDWIVAICLLFVMQYIMSFANMIVGKITEMISDIDYSKGYTSLVEDEKGKIEDKLEEMGYDVSKLKITEDGHDFINWKTNLMGIARLNAQMAKKENSGYAGYAIMFFILVLFTLFFIFTYLKRVLYMAFLTIIAPLVALTYPIDKINDGKAQAFDMWFKEYVFNLLIQPLHLILYTVLVTSAFELAATNMIYSLVALGFMIPAEKLLRKFFGFEKARTPGFLGGAGGAALTMAGMSKLLSKTPKNAGKGNASSGSSSAGASGDSGNVRYRETADITGGGNIDGPELSSGNGNPTGPDLPPSGGNSGIDVLPPEDPVRQSMDDIHTNGPGLSGNRDSDIDVLPPVDPIRTVGNTSPENGPLGNTPLENSSVDSSSNQQPISANGNDDYKESIFTRAGRGVGSGVGTAMNAIRTGKDNIIDKASDTRVGKAARKIKNTPAVRATSAAAKFYAKGMKQKMVNAAKNAHPIRMAAGLAAGAAATTIGVAAGVASGDINNVGKYAILGATSGNKFGQSVAAGIGNTLSVEGSRQEFENTYYGEAEANNRRMQKEIREKQKDYELNQYLEKKLGSKEAAQKAIRENVPEYMSYGIKDKKDMYAIMQLEKQGIERQRAISIASYVNDYGKNTNNLGYKDSDDLNKTIKERAKKNKNVKNEDIDKVATNTRKLMDEYSKIKYKKTI